MAGTGRRYELVHAGFLVEVTYKDVMNLRLRVLAPHGRLAVSVPWHVDERHVRRFIETQAEWIRTAQHKIREAQPVVEPLVDGGRALLWGRWRTLRVIPTASPHAEFDGETIVLGGRDDAALAGALEGLKRRELEAAIPALFAVWQRRIGRQASRIRLRRMTSRWGSCNPQTASITLNTALAEYRPELLEYVAVHELVHLWEGGHGPAFTRRMDAHLPDWRRRRHALRSPAA